MKKARLAYVSPDLAQLIRKADAAQLRRVAAAAAMFAVDRTGLCDPRSQAAQITLAQGNPGDSQQRAEVHQLAEELDEAAWDIQDRVDVGNAPRHSYLHAFAMARAASALCFALDADPLTAALEATYEANAATDDLSSLRAQATTALGQVGVAGQHVGS
jgi:hypothetical protein